MADITYLWWQQLLEGLDVFRPSMSCWSIFAYFIALPKLDVGCLGTHTIWSAQPALFLHHSRDRQWSMIWVHWCVDTNKVYPAVIIAKVYTNFYSPSMSGMYIYYTLTYIYVCVPWSKPKLAYIPHQPCIVPGRPPYTVLQKWVRPAMFRMIDGTMVVYACWSIWKLLEYMYAIFIFNKTMSMTMYIRTYKYI